MHTPANESAAGPRQAQSVARTAVVWDALRAALADFADSSGEVLEIVDAGGGTGGAAVPLAELGHNVTVVEPSPDSLAALERRAAEAGVRVRGLQGDTADLAALLPEGAAHLVLVHNVLEYVDDPKAALEEVVRLARPDGVLSLLAGNALAAVLHRVSTGHLQDAHRLLSDPDGRWGDIDPMPRRFTTPALTRLVEEAGLRVTDMHGVRVFADLVPGRCVDTDPEAARSLVELERMAATHPSLRDIATQLHLLAVRG